MFLTREFKNSKAIALVNEAIHLQDEYYRRVQEGRPIVEFLGLNMLQLHIGGLLVQADDIEDGLDDGSSLNGNFVDDISFQISDERFSSQI